MASLRTCGVGCRGGAVSPPGPIAAYLDAFAGRLAVAPGRRGRILRQVEDHLCDGATSHIDDGVSSAEAEQRAIADCGPPGPAADLFGADLEGRAYRMLFGALRRRRHQLPSAPTVSPENADRPTQGPPPCCDVCGTTIPATELFRADLSAVGDMEAPVTVVLHAACFEMGRALLAMRGTPLVVAPGGQRARPG